MGWCRDMLAAMAVVAMSGSCGETTLEGVAPPPAQGSTSASTSAAADSDSASSTAGANSGDVRPSSTGPDQAASSSGCLGGQLGCPCDDRECEPGLACQQGQCVDGGACPRPGDLEPNDSERGPQEVGEVACGVATEFIGTSGPGDIDWLRFQGLDDGCDTDALAIVDAAHEFEVCAYFSCDQGQAQAVCRTGDASVSQAGRPGCCGAANSIAVSVRCLGAASDDSAQAYVRIASATAPLCTPYSLAFRF